MLSEKENRFSTLTAGQVLTQQREKLGLEPRECAEALKLSLKKVLALEADDNSVFVSDTFIRGYLKNYAKLVNFPPSDIIYIYECQRQLENGKNTPKISTRKVSKKWVPYVIGITVIAFWFYFSQSLDYRQQLTTALSNRPVVEENASQTQEASQGLPANDLPLSDVASSVDEPSAAPLLSNGGLLDVDNFLEVDFAGEPSLVSEPLVVQPFKSNLAHDEVLQQEGLQDLKEGGLQEEKRVASIAKDDPLSQSLVNETTAVELVSAPSSATVANEVATLDPVPLPQKPTPPEEGKLQFSFVENCWVKVVDATGRVLTSRLYIKDTQASISGIAPFFIILGNVRGVSLAFNSEAVVLKPEGQNRILRLTVGK